MALDCLRSEETQAGNLSDHGSPAELWGLLVYETLRSFIFILSKQKFQCITPSSGRTRSIHLYVIRVMSECKDVFSSWINDSVLGQC